MKARTVIELLTLSSNLYLIAKDKEFFEKLRNFSEKGKEKYDEFMEEGEDGEDLLHKLMHKAEEAKVELQHKMEEIAVNVYKKMHIAHADDVSALRKDIEDLRNQLNLADARLKKYESGNPTT